MPETPILTEYLHLIPSATLPEIHVPPTFRAFIIADMETTWGWRFKVGTWLINNGCRFALAWGENCSAWDDDIDYAHLEIWSFEPIPDDQFVITTWHENQTLDEAFEDAHQFTHPVCDIGHTLLLHIASAENRDAMLARFANAKASS